MTWIADVLVVAGGALLGWTSARAWFRWRRHTRQQAISQAWLNDHETKRGQ